MITRAGKVFLLNFFWLNGEGRKKKSRRLIRTLRRLSDKTGTNVPSTGRQPIDVRFGSKADQDMSAPCPLYPSKRTSKPTRIIFGAAAPTPEAIFTAIRRRFTVRQ
jgi:hypothetical protein